MTTLDCRPEFNVVIFNCSLWKDKSLDNLRWAYDNLVIGGHLVIVELARRFPDVVKMETMGWKDTEPVVIADTYKIAYWTRGNKDFTDVVDFSM